MTLFLTSSPCFGIGGDLNPANGLVEELRARLGNDIRCLLITSAPDDTEMTDRMAWEMREAFDRAGMPFDHYEVLDRRTQKFVTRMLSQANFIILCGGHVPTQNTFFRQLRLAQRLHTFRGTILSISAGSMNCADVVYASPELDGETRDTSYLRYLPGLSLTQVNILPHFQMLREAWIDGKRLIDEVVAADSYCRPVYCLTDGTYFLIEGHRTELRGEAYLMLHGKLSHICDDGERKTLSKTGKLRKI